MWHFLNGVLALVLASVAYFFARLYQMRKLMVGLPQPPRHSWLLGNLNIAVECQKHFPADAHPHLYVHYIRKKYDLGKFFYLDWWPLGPQFLHIADPEMTSTYVTTTQSLPKSSLATDFLNLFLGPDNMVSLEGSHWRSLRSMFNPGFATNHLMTLVPYMVDASLVFCDILRRKAVTSELLELESHATNLAIDIIHKVVLNSDLNAQKAPHPIVKTFRYQALIMMPAESINPFAFFRLIRRLMIWRNSRKLDRLIGNELDRKISERTSPLHTNADVETFSGKKEPKRSIVDLAVDNYEKGLQASSNTKTKITSSNDIPAVFRKDIIASMKTFIFAGHDTTASTVAYAFYLLHLYPSKHIRVCAELNAVFGADRSRAADMIKDDPYIVNKLEYTTAIIKETLRLFPPASTLRHLPPESDPAKMSYLTDIDHAGLQFPLNGFVIWPVAHMIMRNETFFPQPVDFIPERFIPSETPFPDAKLFTPAGKDAWRPFEKGPRACIGQELAMIETKVILALTLREFDFVPEFGGVKVKSVRTCESVDEYKQKGEWPSRTTVEGHRCYQILKGAAKPVDGMPGRVLIRT